MVVAAAAAGAVQLASDLVGADTQKSVSDDQKDVALASIKAQIKLGQAAEKKHAEDSVTLRNLGLGALAVVGLAAVLALTLD